MEIECIQRVENGMERDDVLMINMEIKVVQHMGSIFAHFGALLVKIA